MSFAFDPPDIGLGTVDLVNAPWVLAFDTETYRMPVTEVKEGKGKVKKYMRNRTPRLVCSSWAGREKPPPMLDALEAEGAARIVRGTRGWKAVVDRKGTFKMVLWAFDPRSGVTFVGHNLPFDFGVLCNELRSIPTFVTWAFRAFADGRVCDTFIRDKLMAIAEGWLDRDPQSGRPDTSFTLADVVRRRFGTDLSGTKGEDTWRLRYHELDGVPLDSWPLSALEYPMDDAEWALFCALDQAPIGAPILSDQLDPITTKQGGVIDETRQCRKYWGLHLQEVWSVRTDPETVETWAKQIEDGLEAAYAGLTRIGVLRKDGTKNQKVLQALIEADLKASGRFDPERHLTAPSGKFPDGQIKMDGDTLLECTSPELVLYGKSKHLEKYKSTYLRPAEMGIDAPMPYSYNPLVASGRTSSYNTNAQNPPREGLFRECIVPRPGRIFCSVDFTGAELCALGQIHYWVFGHSTLKDTINAGIDPHAPIAAKLWGITVEEFIERYTEGHAQYDEAKGTYRQGAKVPNFGRPGGLGQRTLVDYGSAMGVDFYAIAMTVAEGDPEALALYQSIYDETRATTRWGRDLPEVDLSKDTTSERAKQAVRLAYAKIVLDAYDESIPESPMYMEMINASIGPTGDFTFQQFVSLRQRGGCGYNDGCNTGFQGLIADVGGEVIWRLAVACYVPPEDAVGILVDGSADYRPYWRELDRDGVLEACRALYSATVRPVLFIHDEEIAEGDADTAHIWAPAMAAIMRDAGRMFIPDVNMDAQPALMERWYKKAVDVYDDRGRLVPWRPKKK